MGPPVAELPTVEYDHKTYSIVREGLAEILQPPKEKDDAQEKSQTVFYNHVQQFNRDLSVLAIRVFGEDFELKRKAKESKQRQDGSRKRRENGKSSEGRLETQVPTGDRLETKRKRLEEDDEAGQPQKRAAGQQPRQDVKGGFDISKQAMETNGKSETEHNTEQVANVDLPNGSNLQPTLKILDALSASGLRAIRYAKELPQKSTVTANDLSPDAAKSIALNVQHNGLSDVVFPTTGSAQAHMYQIASKPNASLPDGSHGKYHVVDLDPYGTAAPFLDSAVQATVDGALLCVTCTDAGVFASAGYPEKTYSQYGGLPLRGQHSHEGGLRLVLHAIATCAARYGIAIEPLLSLSIDFYVRVFVRIRRSPSEVKLLAGKTMMVHNCDSGCGAWSTQTIARTQTRENKIGEGIYKFSINQAPTVEPKCEHCGFRTHLAGPMWGGPIQNPFFIQRILDLLPSLDQEVYPTMERIEGMLSTARDETLLPDKITKQAIAIEPAVNEEAASSKQKPDTTTQLVPIPSLPPSLADAHPFFVIPSYLAKILHTTAPSVAALRSALLGLGYRVTRSHTKAGSIRTDAPWSVLWEVMREWARQHHPPKEGAVRPGTSGKGIMRWDRGTPGMLELRAKLKELSESTEGVDYVKIQLQTLLQELGEEDSAVKIKDNEDELPETGSMEVEKASERKAGKRSDAKDTSGRVDGALSLAKLKIVFDESKGKEVQGKKLRRYQMNPLPNWGPMAKAKSSGKEAGPTLSSDRAPAE